MGYLDYLLHTPYSWVTLAAMFCGAAASRMTIRPADATARAQGMKWAGVYLLFAFAVVSGTLAVFVPDASLILDLGLAYQFGGAFVLATLAFRFKLIAGSVVFLAIVVLTIATVFLRQYWTPVSPGESVAVVRVLAQNEGQTTLEFATGKDPSNVDEVSILDIAGTEVGVRAEVLYVAPHYFFLGMGAGVRFQELFGSGGAAYQFPDAAGTSFRIDAVVRRLALPGVEHRETRSDLVSARVLRRYDVVFRPSEPLEIRPTP